MNQSQDDPLQTQNEVFLKYFDISEVIMQYYSKKASSPLEKHFMEIEQFLSQPIQNSSDNKPLVIQTKDGSGRKTLLVKWIEYHQQNNKQNYPIQDIILPFFSTVCEKNTNYFYAIYRILIQLREQLNVKQKVELLEDKLRKYFGYWLGVCTRKIHKQVIKQKISSEAKIILVIDRVDRFIDPSESKEANIAFWLPKELPDKVRVIVTCDRNSESFAYFEKNKARILEINEDIEITSFMVKRNEEKDQFIEPDIRARLMECYNGFGENLKKDCKFVEAFLSAFLPTPNELIPSLGKREKMELNQILKSLEFSHVSRLANLDELMDFILSVYETKIMSLDKFQKLLIMLSISNKGLTLQEIMLLIRVKKEEWDFFIAVFKGFVIEYKTLFCIFKAEFKANVFKRYNKDLTYINSLHEEISEVLEKSSISIRKLEEQTFHLYSSKSYFKLKETVSIIENFLLLFNPNNKFDLCHYWQTLLDNGFDPALEYNKAIEGFEMHYKPSFEDIFRIILQVSRFLKEFSDFETESTPIFRHPPISGNTELNDIGLEEEIKEVDIFKRPDLKRTHSVLSNLEGVNIAKEASHAEFRQHYIEKMKQKMASEQMFGTEIADQIQKFDSKDTRTTKSMTYIGSVIEKSSIQDKPKDSDDSFTHSQVSDYDNNDMPEYRKARDAVMKGLNPKEVNGGPSQLLETKDSTNVNSTTMDKDKKDEKKGKPAFYYYKRWLWMIFPWACLSQNKKCNYSKQIMKSYSSATRYISVLEENKYTKRALKIALEAKLKKKMIYGKKEEIDLELHTLKNMKKEMWMLEQMDRHDKIELEFEKDKTSIINSTMYAKNKVRLDPLNETSSLSKALGNSMSGTQNNRNKEMKAKKASATFFLTQEPGQKAQGQGILSKMEGKSKMSFNKEKFSSYDEGKRLLNGLSIEEKSLRILPKLKDSITAHNKGALKVVEREVKELKNEYDGLLYSNKVLEKKLKEMKFVESNNNLFGSEKDDFNVGLLREKVQTLGHKLRENMEIFEETQNQKNRINTILTICKKNKMQNGEYIRSLNYLLTNFKKCIRKEHESIKRNQIKTKSIRQLTENLIKLVGDNLNNHSKLVSQIKTDLTNKLKFDASFAETDKKILNSTMLKNSVENKTKKEVPVEETRKRSPTEKNLKLINDKLETIKDQYEKLEELLEGENGENFEDKSLLESEKFQNFKIYLENRSEVLQQNMEKQDKIDILTDILEAKKSHLASLKRSTEQASEDNELQKNDCLKLAAELEKQHEIKCRNFVTFKQTILNSMMTLNSLLDKVNPTGTLSTIDKLEKFESEPFTKTLTEYMEKIKLGISEEEYREFENMKVGPTIKFDLQQLQVNVASNASFNLNDD